MPCFNALLTTSLMPIGTIICDYLRDVLWKDIFKLSASAAAREFCKWVHVGIDVYILYRKYQVKPHLSPWFSAACAAATVHRNHFFLLYQMDKSESKVNFRQAHKRCKRVLEAAKLAYANKRRSHSLPRNLAFVTFGEYPIVFSKGKSAIPPLFNSLKVSSSASVKAKLLKNFLRTLILMTQVSLYLFFLLELI